MESCQFCTREVPIDADFDTAVCRAAYEENPIRQLISDHTITVRSLAEFAECSPSQITRACLGDQLPTARLLRQIGRAVGEAGEDIAVALREWHKAHAPAIQRRHTAIEEAALEGVRQRIRELKSLIEARREDSIAWEIAQAAIGRAEAAATSYDHEPSQARRTIWLGVAASSYEAARLAWELV